MYKSPVRIDTGVRDDGFYHRPGIMGNNTKGIPGFVINILAGYLDMVGLFGGPPVVEINIRKNFTPEDFFPG